MRENPAHSNNSQSSIYNPNLHKCSQSTSLYTRKKKTVAELQFFEYH